MKWLIIRAYICHTFFDICSMCINPLLPKDKKANWRKMRKATYQLINALIGLKIQSLK